MTDGFLLVAAKSDVDMLNRRLHIRSVSLARLNCFSQFYIGGMCLGLKLCAHECKTLLFLCNIIVLVC